MTKPSNYIQRIESSDVADFWYHGGGCFYDPEAFDDACVEWVTENCANYEQIGELFACLLSTFADSKHDDQAAALLGRMVRDYIVEVM